MSVLNSILVMVVAWLSVQQRASATLNAKAWQSLTEFTTASDFPEVELLKSKPNTAIGFTGGGSRAYVASFGILSGLHQLDLLKNIRYVSGISGGAWASSTFTYAQNVDDDKFLCPILAPEDMTHLKLMKMDDQCARSFAAADLSFVAAKAWKDKIVDTIPSGWSYAVSKQYLEPVGITKNTRFSWNAETVADIKARNPDLAGETFLLPSNSKRPYFLIGTTLVGPSDGSPYTTEHQNFTMIEITPLYVGQMKNQDVEYSYKHFDKLIQTRRVGGVIEPFAYSRVGSGPTTGLTSKQSSGTLKVPEPTTFIDLQFAAGASSYAPGALVESLSPEELANALGMPFDYWSPASPKPETTTTLFADGGSYENIPLISFLQRRVPKIVLFMVSSTPLMSADKYNPAVDEFDGTQLSDTVTCFFGVLAKNTPNWQNRSYEYEKDQVFATSDYAPVVSALQAAQAKGEGIIATFNLTTIENKWWGVPAGINAEITISYLGRLQAWEKKLSDDMKDLLVPKENASDMSVDIDSGEFKGFPHYVTAGGGINAERANALADLTGWSILNNADTFKKIFS